MNLDRVRQTIDGDNMKKLGNPKKKMSKIVSKYYLDWLNGTKLFGDLSDEQRFYRFAKSCIRYCRSRVNGHWLRGHLEEDLSHKYPDEEYREEVIQKAVSLFDHIMEYENTQFPDHLVEMNNPTLVKMQLRGYETFDGNRSYSDKKIEEILSNNFSTPPAGEGLD